MAREGLTPTPSKDLDVFGKELPLTSAEKQILTGEETIFLKKVLSIEISLKKGETTEPRILVISSSKCYLLSQKPVTKLDSSFNFLKIQKLECTEKTLTFHLSREQRPLKLHVDKKDSVEILGLITAQLRNVFPVTPLEMIMQTVFTPVSLREETMRLRDGLLSAMDRLDPTSLHGFITAYGFLCDFFSVSFNDEVIWYLKNVYLTHGFRDLKLHDFNHLATKDVRPIVSALRHNEFFEGIVEKDNRTDGDLLEEIGYVLNASRTIKKLVLNNCSLKPDNVVRLSVAVKNNPKASLTHLDLSHNPLEDRAVESLGLALESLTHGLKDLRLANCKMTPRAATLLANCMMNNKHIQHSLVYLDLSSNPLGPDPQGSLGFLKEPQTVATLKLSNCGLNFEFVTPILIRGCQQHLRVMDLSLNAGRAKKCVHGVKVAGQLQQFCSSAISIATINLSGCKLSGEMTIGLLEGLCINPNVQNIELNLSGNDLGVGRDTNSVAKVIARTSCLERLDVSESGIESCLVAYIAAVRKNRNISHLSIGKNFNGKGNSRAAALKSISEFLSSEDCHLRSLSLANSHLRDSTATILEALAGNRSLHKLDISGNGIGNHGARRLAKALLSNCSLREVVWDHNDTSLHGFKDVAAAMEHNYTLRVMPIPLYDIGKATAREPHEVEKEVQKMQVYLCRNHSDERLKVELAARHRQRLLTATQQSGVVSRELVQLEDLLKWSERGLAGAAENEGAELVAEAILVREEANKVLQLTDGLYSPNAENEQFESVSGQVAELLDGLMGRLHHQHVQENSEHMVSRSVKACPSLLSDKDRNLLGKLVVTEMGSEFEVAWKTVVHKVVPEIINPISASNLDVAATISEHLVEKTLIKLEKISSKLIKLQKALQKKTSSGATPDQKVSRAFTFRVDGEEQPKVTRRRPLSTDSDTIDLPSSPLVTEAPQLEHIAKSRPKPARLQKGGNRRPHKPSHLSKAKEEVDVGDFVKAMRDAEQNSLRHTSKDENKTKPPAKTPLRLPAVAKETKPEPPASEEKEVEEIVTEEGDGESAEGGEVEGTEEEVVKEEEEEEVKSEAKEEEKTVVIEEEEKTVEDNDSEEKEEEKGKEVVEEKSPPVSKKADSKPVSSPRSPPLTPPPSPPHSPPHSPVSPPPITTPKNESTSTNDNADESSSSVEMQTLAKKETSPSPSEDNTSRDRKKSRKVVKKEEKEREKKEKEEREKEKREREREEKEREKKEKEEKEAREREKKEKEKREKEEKERERKEKEKREKEERERERKEREKEEKEKEKREKEEKEKQKKAEKRRGSEDLLTVNGGRDQRETSPGRTIEKRKSKTVRETRKKGGLSKLFGRPKGKEEGDEAVDAMTEFKTDDIPSDPHKSPRRQTTVPTKRPEGELMEERGTVTPEPQKRPPPPRVKSKPVKSKSVDFGVEGRGEEEGDGEDRRRRPVGGVAAMPIFGLAPSQLVLKPRPSPQPRSKPPSEANSPALSEKTPSDSTHHSSPLTIHKTPPTAPRPRPKPKPRKSVVDVKGQEGEEEDKSVGGNKEELEKPATASGPATPTVSPSHQAGGEEREEGVKGEAEVREGDKEGTEDEKKGEEDVPEDKAEPSKDAGVSPSDVDDDTLV